MREFRAIAVGILLGASGVASAETVIEGGQLTDATWTPAGSPYLMNGTVEVPVGGHLTIEPGTTIAARSQTPGDPPPTLRIAGTLTARGTAAMPIMMTKQPGDLPWGGVDLAATAVDSVIEHTTVEDTYDGITVRATATSNRIAHVTILEAQRFGIFLFQSAGMHLDGITVRRTPDAGVGAGISSTTTGEVIIENSYVSGHRDGINYSSGPSMIIRNTVITGNLEAGLWLQPGLCQPQCTARIDQSTITDNGGHGIYVIAGGSMNAEVVGSIITGHTAYAVENSLSSRGVIAVWDSLLFGNAQETANAALGDLVVEDPRFVGDGDFRLAAGSPAIDRVATGPATDADGAPRPVDGDGDGDARYDLGAYEYQPAGSGPDAGMDGDGDGDDGDGGGGCCSTGGGGGGSPGSVFALALLVLAVVLTRGVARR
jgi:hypothetical protein